MGDKKSTAVRVAWHLAEHDGVITTDEALALGMSGDQVHRRVACGLWVPHARSVFLSAEHRMTDAARLRIALAANGGVADRSAAAWLHGLIDDLHDEVTLSVPRSTHGVACRVPTAVRRRTFPAEDLTRVRGLPTTALPLTLLAAASELGVDDGISLMDRALQTRCVTLKELRGALERNSGAYGMRLARRILTAAEDLSESELERKFVRFLRKHGIVGWTQQVWIGGRRMDFVWPAERIVVSLHGWAFHKSHSRWETDQETTSALASQGWVPLIYTWKRLEFRPEGILRELSHTLEQRQIAA